MVECRVHDYMMPPWSNSPYISWRCVWGHRPDDKQVMVPLSSNQMCWHISAECSGSHASSVCLVPTPSHLHASWWEPQMQIPFWQGTLANWKLFLVTTSQSWLRECQSCHQSIRWLKNCLHQEVALSLRRTNIILSYLPDLTAHNRIQCGLLLDVMQIVVCSLCLFHCEAN